MLAIVLTACLAGAPRTASAQAGGPLPYAPIANPLPDTLDQLYRDSLNIKFSRIRVNQAGYPAGDRRFFYSVGAAGSAFQVLDGNRIVATGALAPTGQSASGQLSIRANLNAFKSQNTRYRMEGPVYAGPVSEGEIPASVGPGRYRIAIGADTSAPFLIDDRIYAWVRDALLKFFGVNRSGRTDSWFHPPSHLKDGPNGDGSLTGGWYDCGDHLKESMSMSYATSMLGLLAAAWPDRDADHYGRNQNDTWRTDGVPDMLYEAKIGVDFYLKSFDLAKGDPAKMWTSVGYFGGDHGWWGQPQFQDALPVDRGGPVRELRNEVGANIMGRLAAGMACFAARYAGFDKPYADRCLAAAKKMYEYGKANRKSSGSSGAYPTETSLNDDMALAAVALLYATKDTTYKFDLVANPALGTFANPYFATGTFAGGWMVATNTTLQKGGSNTSYANVHTPTLWAFYRLILKDPAVAAACGISAAERLDLMEDVAFNIIDNIGWLQGGSAKIELPSANPQLPGGHTLTYDPLWKLNTKADVIWVWNRYAAGNTAEFFCYYDIAKDLQGVALPHTPANVDWKAGEVRQLIVRQMDYMLGVNPWDISMIYGVGAKNFNHPHHRAANPEGTNVPGAFYRYRPPVGALQGGFPPGGGDGGAAGTYKEDWEDYTHAESCLDGTTTMLFPVVGLAKEDSVAALGVQVVIEYVGVDHAILVVRQDRFGTAAIRYGTAPDALVSLKAADSAGIEHRIVLTGLAPGTTYYFQAEAKDLQGRAGLNDNGGNKFRFTTLAQPPGAAKIAQVKVCNVTHNSAEILWYTPNGQYDSKVVYGTGKPPAQVHDGDVAAHPVKLHYVRLDSLKEKTQYWFYVESNGVRDDNQGAFYTFTTGVEHVEFDIRALTYAIGDKQYLGFNIVNQDSKSYDSLDVRLYMRATPARMADFGARADIGQAYLSTGFLDPSNAFKTALDTLIQKQRPVRMDDTFDPATGTYVWYISLPMGNATMHAGARFRVDVTFTKRNENGDLLDEPATYVPGPKDWSWSPHSRAQGDPVDFGGVKAGTKEAVDDNYFATEIDPYITVYRKGQFVWGFSPSAKEQATKIAHYVMTASITAPLHYPPEDYKVIDQPSSTVHVKGTVAITDAGQLTDVWVNGEKASLSAVAAYDKAANAWNLDVPVKLEPGPNEVDITLFGGATVAGSACGTAGSACVGCAFQDLHFHLDWRKSDAYPSSLVLLDSAGAVPLAPLAPASERFVVSVTDKSGDRTAGIDTLAAEVANANAGQRLVAILIETGPRTGIFRAQPILAQDGASGPGSIALADGDSVWVTYRDPTDPDDSSRAFLYRPATFPQALGGWYLDSDADGSVDKAIVLFSKPLAQAPDSLRLWFPDSAAVLTLAGAGLRPAGARLEVPLVPPFAAGVTGFTGDNRNSGRAFLTADGKPRATAFALADSAGPVLNRAVLRASGDAAAPDTLALVFSEPVEYGRAVHPFEPWQGGRTVPAGDLGVTGVLSGAGAEWIVLLAPGSPARLDPGDSLRLVAGPSGGIRDAVGNFPATGNRRVIVEGQPRKPPAILSLAWDTRPFAAPDITATGAEPAFAILARDGAPGRPALLITADRPFRYETAVFSNLGAWVAGASGTVAADAAGAQDPATGAFQVRLVWSGRAGDGAKAGTGAYIWRARATLLSPAAAGRPPLSAASSRTIGVLRKD